MAHIEFESNELGWFGWTWPEKVSFAAKRFLLVSQVRQMNPRVVNNVHQRYLSLLLKGFKPIDFLENMGDVKFRTWDRNSLLIINELRRTLNMSLYFVDAVLRALYEMAIEGKIPYSKLNPQQAKDDKKSEYKFKDHSLRNKMLTVGILGSIAITGIYLQSRRDKKKWQLKRRKR